jgi:hypothetical protein
MAGTVVQGNVGTEEFLADEKQIDMDEKIRMLRPDESQFTTMSSRISSRSAVREKVNWLEEEDFPRLVSLSAGALSGATTLVLTAGQGKIVRVNDVLRNMRTGRGELVTAIATDTLTVSGIGAAPAAASNSGDVYLVVGDAQPQGSDFPASKYLQRVLGYNFTEITRTTWTYTGTATAIELYGGREPAKEAVRKAREHKRKWEAIGFFGARSFVADAGAANGNEPMGTAGGLIEFIQTNAKTITTLTPDAFDLFLMDVMQYGSDNKVLFAAPVVVAQMSKWNRTGMGTQYAGPDGGKVHGVQIDAYISGAYGYRIPVVVKKEWQEFYNAATPGYGNMAFLVDMDYVERRPLRDRDTKLLTEQQPKGKDTYAAEYFTEATYEIAHERAHSLIKGVVYS